MKQVKISWIRRSIAAALAILLLAGIVINVSAFAEEGENSEPVTTSETENSTSPTSTPSPTFAVDEDSDNSLRIKVGNNSLLFGNDFAVREDVKGLLFTAGNYVRVENATKYGFIAGNTVDFSGATQNDVFIAGNLITIDESAKIGGDVFVAGNELVVQTDLFGDLAFTGSTIKIDDIVIRGNVNLSVDKIIFDGSPKIDGSLTYNDSAAIVGLSNAEIQNVESYHLEEQETSVATELYAKFLGMMGLFVVMVVMIFLMPRLKHEVSATTTAQSVAIRMATGAWAVILIPILAIFALCSVVGVPLGLILLVLYIIAFYVSQGFAGVWVGHMIIEKIAKSSTNTYIKALVGIVVLNLLSLIPYINGIVYILSLLLGFGMIIHHFNPSKKGENNIDSQMIDDHDDSHSSREVKNHDKQLAEKATSDREALKAARNTKNTKAVDGADNANGTDGVESASKNSSKSKGTKSKGTKS